LLPAAATHMHTVLINRLINQLLRSACSVCLSAWTNVHWDRDNGQLARSTIASMQYLYVWLPPPRR